MSLPSHLCFTYAFASGTGPQFFFPCFFIFPMRGKFFTLETMDGDVNAEVRVCRPSLRYAFDSIFHQDIDGVMSRLRFDCRRRGIKIPLKGLVPFRHLELGWSPNLHVCQCEFLLPKLYRRLSVFLFYHICHTSSMFENTEILSAKKKPPRGWKEPKRSWPISGMLLVRMRMRRVYKSYPLRRGQ